jgi:hypothetical protein
MPVVPFMFHDSKLEEFARETIEAIENINYSSDERFKALYELHEKVDNHILETLETRGEEFARLPVYPEWKKLEDKLSDYCTYYCSANKKKKMHVDVLNSIKTFKEDMESIIENSAYRPIKESKKTPKRIFGDMYTLKPKK